MAYTHPVFHGGKNHPEQVTEEFLAHRPDPLRGHRCPKILQCGHTFSLSFLEQNVPVNGRTVVCPTCGQSNPVPAGGLAALSDNLFVDTQVDRLLRRHNKDRGRDDTLYNISAYELDGRRHAYITS